MLVLNADLDDMLAQACSRAGDYLQHHPNVSDRHRRLCDGIGPEQPSAPKPPHKDQR